MSKGIDYSLGLANVNPTTGIHYGVISPHSVNPDALSDVYDHGEKVPDGNNLNNRSNSQPLVLSSAERIEAAAYMRLAHEYIVATINDARSSKRAGTLLLARLQADADSAAALASRLAR